MTITVPSPVVRVRAYEAGGTYQPAPVESLSTPTLTLTDEIGRIIRAEIGNIDSRADFYRLYLNGDNPPTTLVGEYPWYALETYETADLGDGVTRYGRAVAVLGEITASSTVQSATTDSAIPAPGAPSNPVVTDNGDGTISGSCTFADEYHNENRFQIWVQSSTSWVTLVNNDGDLDENTVTNVAVPGSSGATVNASGQYGFRWRLGQSGTNIVTAEYWVAVADPDAGSGFTPGTVSLTANSATEVNAQFGTDPSVTPTSVQLQRTLTETEGDDGAWDDVSGATNYATLTGAGFDDTNTASTNYSYRIEVVYDGETKYTPIGRVTTPAASGGGTLLSGGNFNALAYPSGMTKFGTTVISSDTGDNYNGSAGSVMTPYTASAGQQGLLVHVFTDRTRREVYVRFYAKNPLASQGGCKFCKMLGQRDGDNYSNFSFYTEQNTGDLRGVAFGEGNGAANDAQNYVRMNGTHNLTRSTPTFITTTSTFSPDTSWHLFELYFKQNSMSGATPVADGAVIIKIDGTTRLHATNFINRHNDSLPFDKIHFFDFTAATTAGAWEQWYDNISISVDDWVVVS